MASGGGGQGGHKKQEPSLALPRHSVVSAHGDRTVFGYKTLFLRAFVCKMFVIVSDLQRTSQSSRSEKKHWFAFTFDMCTWSVFQFISVLLYSTLLHSPIWQTPNWCEWLGVSSGVFRWNSWSRAWRCIRKSWDAFLRIRFSWKTWFWMVLICFAFGRCVLFHSLPTLFFSVQVFLWSRESYCLLYAPIYTDYSFLDPPPILGPRQYPML